MDDRTLAHLRWVDPATAWKSERDDFLLWPIQPENLRRLGAALSLRLRPVRCAIRWLGPRHRIAIRG